MESKHDSPAQMNAPSFSARSEVADMFQKISAVAVVNQEIIQRIQSKESVTTYKYTLQSNLNTPNAPFSYPLLSFKEHKYERSAQTIVASFAPSSAPGWRELEPVEDFFNDRLDYSCSSFQDIIRINTDMPRIAKKFDMFAEHKAAPFVRQFLENMNSLQVALGRLEGQLKDEESSLGALQAELKDSVNDIVKAAVKKMVERNGVKKAIQKWSELTVPPPVTDGHDSMIVESTGLQIDRVMDWIQQASGKEVRELKLLWRGSRDGYTAQAFHQRCDNQAPLLVLVTAKETGAVYGGYTPVAYAPVASYNTQAAGFAFSSASVDGSGFIAADSGKAFLFSSSMGNLVRYINRSREHALYYNRSCGPTFGRGHDFMICNSCNASASSSFTPGCTYHSADASNAPNGPFATFNLGQPSMGPRVTSSFTVNEIEAFAVDF